MFPNSGFQQQLELWGAMGCRIDPDCGAWRRYQLMALGRQWEETGAIDPADLAAGSDGDSTTVCPRIGPHYLWISGLPKLAYTSRRSRLMDPPRHVMSPTPLVRCSSDDPPTLPAAVQVCYRCRKCRRVLASERNCIDVEPGSGGDAFSWRKRDKGAAGRAAKYSGGADPGGGAPEPALWVQPLRWMDGVLDSVQGKIDCPG